MTDARFLQIHTLHSYSAVLLNRDDSGLAKRLPFGGAMRTRISSQCLKRHWRVADDEWALRHVGVPMGVRSRQIFDRRIFDALIANGIAESAAQAFTEVAFKAVFQESPKAKKAREKEEEKGTTPADFETKQAVLLGQPEIDYLLDLGRKATSEGNGVPDATRKAAEALFKSAKKNIEALRAQAGLEGAMFGRMVTSDLLARSDAAIHVAHAFTVHAEQAESDYFTVVDDLVEESGEAGAGGIFDTELTSGLFYGYVVVDVPLLISNLSGERDTAAKVVEHLVHLIATVSPGAKKGSTAPYAWAHLMLVEAGRRQPRSLANAFIDPVQRESAVLVGSATDALSNHVAAFDGMYGAKEERALAAIVPASMPGAESMGLDNLAAWAAARVRG